jgi:hypothetical protein
MPPNQLKGSSCTAKMLSKPKAGNLPRDHPPPPCPVQLSILKLLKTKVKEKALKLARGESPPPSKTQQCTRGWLTVQMDIQRTGG